MESLLITGFELITLYTIIRQDGGRMDPNYSRKESVFGTTSKIVEQLMLLLAIITWACLFAYVVKILTYLQCVCAFVTVTTAQMNSYRKRGWTSKQSLAYLASRHRLLV